MTSAYVKPQRDNVGLVFPEMLIHSVLRDMQEKLALGKYGDGNREEPIVQQFRGISERTIEGLFNSLRKPRQPKLSLAFPTGREAHMLPWISIIPEGMSEYQVVLNDAGEDIAFQAEAVEETTTLAPLSGVVAGETEFQFPQRNIDAQSTYESIYIVRGGENIPLNWIDDDFTVDAATGVVTLAAALIAGDSLVCTEYIYYGLEGGTVVTSFNEFNHVIFVDTLNPLLTHFLVGLVWRELMINRVVMQQNGLDDIRISRRSLSLWDASVPAIGFRAEVVVSGKTEWTAYSRVVRNKLLYNEIDDASGDFSTETGPDSVVAISVEEE